MPHLVSATAIPGNATDLFAGSEPNQNRLGGFGSDLFYNSRENVYYALVDRGPGGGVIPYQTRVEKFSIDLDPETGAIRSYKLIGTVPFTISAGATLNGKTYSSETPFNGLNPQLLNSDSSLLGLSQDPEGLVVGANGNFFVSDEYGPSIYEFSSTGSFIRAFTEPANVLPKNGSALNFATDGSPLTTGRQDNRGYEGLAIRPDGQKLFAVFQDPLQNEGTPNGRSSRNVRIVQFDVATGQSDAQYIYQLESLAAINDRIPGTTNDFGSTSQGRNIGISSLIALDDQQLLIIERDNRGVGVGDPQGTLPVGSKRIYKIDLTDATDVSGLTLTRNDLPADVTPVSKTLFLDIAEALQTAGQPIPEKFEGVTIGPKLADGSYALLLATDNDFSVTQDSGNTQFDVYTNGVDSQQIPIGAAAPAGYSLLPSYFYSFKTDATALGGYSPTAPTSLPNGVASGDTTQNSTVLWTRSNFTGAVQFEYSTSSTFDTIAGSQTAIVSDPLQPVKVSLTGLNPDTTYYYRATDAAGATATGKLSTAAAVGTHTGLRFGASGDWRGELSPYPAIANVADQNLKFFIELGDTIYADYPSPALNKPQAETLDEYRFKHNEVYDTRYGKNTWSDLRSSTSVLSTLDDHEVINDFAGGEPANTDPRFKDGSTQRINDTTLFENGVQAFQEYNPIQDQFYGEGDPRTAGERKLYRYNTYGSDAATFLLDARSFRDAELPGVTNVADPAQVSAFLAGSFDPSRTLLGRPQLEDLKHDLLDAESQGITWKYVIVPEPIQNLGVLAAGDRFEGYAAERTELLKFINDNDVSNVVFITADIHSTLVNNLTYQLAPGQAQIPTSAFEISTGSVAFDAPFGPTVADLATQLKLLTPEQKALYDSLPTPGKDAFIKQLTNTQLQALGYDPLGLDNNLAIADGKIDAKLLKGDYVALNTYGWTEFDVDATTQKLTVTTYGIPYYTEAELKANPAAITNLTSTIVSQFEVNPTLTQLGGSGNDTLYGTEGRDRLKGNKGNDLLLGAGGDDTLIGGNGIDTLDGGTGNDTLRGGAGNDYLFGRSGSDVFVFAKGEGTDAIADFNLAEGDRIGLTGGLSFGQITLKQEGANTALNAGNEVLAILTNFSANSLSSAAFVTV